MPLNDFRGTPGYAAPELCRTYLGRSREAITPKADVFSLGVTLLEIWLGRSPFAGMRFPAAPRNWVQKGLPWEWLLIMRWLAEPGSNIFKLRPNPARQCLKSEHFFVGSLIHQCCQADPKKRPSAAEVEVILGQELSRHEDTRATVAADVSEAVMDKISTGGHAL
ncbi:hypothetical protein WJX84_000173 [Apatococcus fuscideae]